MSSASTYATGSSTGSLRTSTPSDSVSLTRVLSSTSAGTIQSTSDTRFSSQSTRLATPSSYSERSTLRTSGDISQTISSLTDTRSGGSTYAQSQSSTTRSSGSTFPTTSSLTGTQSAGSSYVQSQGSTTSSSESISSRNSLSTSAQSGGTTFVSSETSTTRASESISSRTSSTGTQSGGTSYAQSLSSSVFQSVSAPGIDTRSGTATQTTSLSGASTILPSLSQLSSASGTFQSSRESDSSTNLGSSTVRAASSSSLSQSLSRASQSTRSSEVLYSSSLSQLSSMYSRSAFTTSYLDLNSRSLESSSATNLATTLSTPNQPSSSRLSSQTSLEITTSRAASSLSQSSLSSISRPTTSGFQSSGRSSTERTSISLTGTEPQTSAPTSVRLSTYGSGESSIPAPSSSRQSSLVSGSLSATSRSASPPGTRSLSESVSGSSRASTASISVEQSSYPTTVSQSAFTSSSLVVTTRASTTLASSPSVVTSSLASSQTSVQFFLAFERAPGGGFSTTSAPVVPGKKAKRALDQLYLKFGSEGEVCATELCSEAIIFTIGADNTLTANGRTAYATPDDVSSVGIHPLRFGTPGQDDITASFDYASGTLSWSNELFPASRAIFGASATDACGIVVDFDASLPYGYLERTFNLIMTDDPTYACEASSTVSFGSPSTSHSPTTTDLGIALTTSIVDPETSLESVVTVPETDIYTIDPSEPAFPSSEGFQPTSTESTTEAYSTNPITGFSQTTAYTGASASLELPTATASYLETQTTEGPQIGSSTGLEPLPSESDRPTVSSGLALTSRPAISSTASSLMTTSTVYTTQTYTITSCHPTVTNCSPGQVVTTTVPVYTTVCPITPTPTHPPDWTTSTVQTTITHTITACPSAIQNCPIGHVTTETIDVYTTVCPISPVGPVKPEGPGDHESCEDIGVLVTVIIDITVEINIFHGKKEIVYHTQTFTKDSHSLCNKPAPTERTCFQSLQF